MEEEQKEETGISLHDVDSAINEEEEEDKQMRNDWNDVPANH